MNEKAAKELLREWSRDLSLKTEPEIRLRWGEDGADAINEMADRFGLQDFEEELRDHNPIYYFAQRLFFDNVLDDPMYLYPPLHREILCHNVLEYYFSQPGDDSGLLILMPRDTFKSTFMHGVVPFWVALRERFVNGRNVCSALIHQKEQQAVANLSRIRSKIVAHQWLKEFWPEASAGDSDARNTKTAVWWPWVRKGDVPEPSLMAAGLGADFTGFHFHNIFCSDLVIKEHMQSKLLRDDTMLRHEAMAYTLTIGTGKRYYDGTRYHVNDLYANMLKANVDGKPMYRHVVVKSISDEDDSLAHPHRLTHKVLESIRQEEISRSGNDFMFHLQMQNEPKTSGLIATDPSWLHYMSVREVPATAWRIITCDPAWKGTKNAGQGDYAAIQVWAFERRGPLVLRFLLDQVHSNEMTSLDGMNAICRLMRKWGVIDVSIEEIGGYIFSTDLEQQCTARGLPFNLLENKARTTNKAQRIVTFLRAMQAGHVFLITEAPHLDAFKDEFLNFPQVEHDDLLDCAAQTSDPAILELYAPGIYKKPTRWSDQFRSKPKQHFDTRHCAM